MEDIIYGKHAVREALQGDVEVNKIFVVKDSHPSGMDDIFKIVKEMRLVVSHVDRRKMESLCGGGNHQGIALSVSPFHYAELEELIREDEPPFLLLLDGIQDPHNLGAIIRSAYAAGVHGIVIPKRRAVGVNSTVVKTSGGYASQMPIARVTNMTKTIEWLKSKNIWVAGADMGGDMTLFNGDMKGAFAIVMGSEGSGISRLVKEKCDFIISIPMLNGVESLNASVAASLIIYEAFRQRMK
jgi:23S rRNA (guanosine2251-2'-O)-methyltransferase